MKTERKNSFLMALSVLLVNILVLLTGVVFLKLEPHVPILINIGIVLCFGILRRISWAELIAGMHKAVADSVGVFLTILMVGVVVGAWTMCGTVPVVIYYGLMFFSPQWFLISIMILCFIMAFVTGSSWTTAGTIGVAFMGVGISLGIPAGLTAGCIISGAMCGDKQSPLGAATNLTAAISKVDLYETLHSLVYVTIPSIVGCGIIFTVLGFRYSKVTADTTQVEEIMNGLASTFHLSPVLILPIIVLLILIFLKIPTVPTLITASLCGVLLSVLYQGNSLGDSLSSMYYGYVSDSGIDLLDRLLTRGGLMAMASTILLIILALALAGCLERTSIMSTVIGKISGILQKRFSVIMTSYIMSTVLGFFSADCHMAIVLTSNAMGERFDKLGIHKCVLARTVHDGATGLAPLVPWTTAGVYFSATLGVTVAEYVPFYMLALTMTAATLFFAATGLGVRKSK
ncbi:Malate-2H(+)/Na(+)-lactate antiporter [uncultured Eubacterium sp.]|nr:Malate-2H(+)/Na(+)-lactate antiporter [uncultured Eubacterium sp.]